MSMVAPFDTGDDSDSERIIDRSGDIDQRPPDERAGCPLGTAVSIPRPTRRELAAPIENPEPPRFQEVPSSLPGLAARLQKDLDKHHAKAKAQLDGLCQKIEAHEKRCLPPKLGEDLQQIRFQRQKILIANGPLLSSKLAEERGRLADLEHFKSLNRLVRDAHYPSSPLLGLGILFFLVLLEAGINGIFFADTSDQGLLGGWLEALVLSCTNVGAAFLFGRLVIPQLHNRSLFLKALGLTLAGACVLILGGINLAGAHYRDFKTELAREAVPPAPSGNVMPVALPVQKPAIALLHARKSQAAPTAAAAHEERAPPKEAVKERDAIAQVFMAPFTFHSFMSFFLFVTGLCGATIAAADGYRFDDPFPGYGRRHRSYQQACAARTEALNRTLHQSNAIMTGNFQVIGRKMEAFAQEMSSLLVLHHAYASDHKSLSTRLEGMVQDAEAEIAAHERLHLKVRNAASRELYTLSMKPLPPLSEKHVRFYETQDKKLKALQRAVQKEQGDLLGVFGEASADFQRLLAECSQASLSAASVSIARESA